MKSGTVKQDERLRKITYPVGPKKYLPVKKRVPRRRPVCTIADYHGEELEDTFYEQEL